MTKVLLVVALLVISSAVTIERTKSSAAGGKSLVALDSGSRLTLKAADSLLLESNLAVWGDESPPKLKNKDYKKWMSFLPDDALFLDLNIPGTHDTMAYDVSSTKIGMSAACEVLRRAHVITQAGQKQLDVQFADGIRGLDIRLKATRNGQLMVHHGPCELGPSYKQVLEKSVEFLKA